MEWPQDLLEIFEDPLLSNVRPKVSAPTADDRLNKKFEEVKAWIAVNHREPERSGDLKEKMMFAAMTALREKGFDV